ncbi:MAG: hypothetical protein AB8G23_18045 [Myxococcota bacterium]
MPVTLPSTTPASTLSPLPIAEECRFARTNPARRSAQPVLSMLLALSLTFSFALIFAVAPAAAAPGSDTTEATEATEATETAGLSETAPLLLAQAGGDAGRSRPLEPTYQPREPEPEGWYNGSYVFALTRGVADSTIAPAGQVPLYVLTVPLDIAFLPFALIGGLFG